MSEKRFKAVVIGASAGALEALSALLPSLPENYSLPVMVVVHIPPDKNSVLADLFQARCKMNVCEAEDKIPLQPGMIYFAPPDYHLLVEPNGRLSLSSEEPVLFSRPSIDVLFESAADVYDEGLIGVILTGANPDGAKGLQAIMIAGGTGLVQDPALAHATEMPRAAIKACPDAQVLNLEGIAAYLREAALL